VLSERTTAFEGTKNRQNNVRVATAAIYNNGNTILAPGEEFSFLKLVGDRTPEQGYKEAFGIQANGSLDGELGGGICQVATTVFNAAFWAGLKVTERRNHSMFISHYPEGRDAAVTTDTDGTIDLKFVNDTDHYIWIKGESDGITTTFWIYGTSDGRKVTFRDSGKYNVGAAPPVWQSVDNSLPPGKVVIISPGQPRMQIKITRWVTWPDGTVKEDVFMSQYYQRPKIVHVGP
jgi:vancomycin resistance protein YoaR